MEVPPNSCNPMMTRVVKGGGRRSKQQRPGMEEPLVGKEEGGEKEADHQRIGTGSSAFRWRSFGEVPSTVCCWLMNVEPRICWWEWAEWGCSGAQGPWMRGREGTNPLGGRFFKSIFRGDWLSVSVIFVYFGKTFTFIQGWNCVLFQKF